MATRVQLPETQGKAGVLPRGPKESPQCRDGPGHETGSGVGGDSFSLGITPLGSRRCGGKQTKSAQHRGTAGLDQPHRVLGSSKSDACALLVRLNIMVPFKCVRVRLTAEENLSSVSAPLSAPCCDEGDDSSIIISERVILEAEQADQPETPQTLSGFGFRFLAC